jgi:predicted ester cyclase
MSARAELLWSTDNTVPATDVLAETYINHQPGGGKAAEPLDLAAYLAFMEEFHKSFSSQEVKVVQVVVEGDMSAARFESTAIHSGEFMGVAPTGKEITWTGVQIDRFENGKIVESWVNWDEYGFYKQLGLIP